MHDHTIRPGRALLCMALACLLFLPLVACAPRHAPGPEADAPPEIRFFRLAQQRWNVFQNAIQGAPQGPLDFNAAASLNYASPSSSHRVVLNFYGSTNLPLRLDLAAGIGTTIAHWREDAEGFTAYVPEEETAYIFPDSKAGMAAFGLPLPYGLQDLAQLLTGRWSALVPSEYESAVAVDENRPEGPIRYALQGPDGRFQLTLDEEALPTAYTSPGAESWELTFTRVEKGPAGLIPGRIRMVRSPQEKALLFLKDLSILEEAVSAEKLRIELPPGTKQRIYAAP
ncbi:MAG: hypothetical protein ACOCWR_04925 [Oceanidesulfovibrio sp.]